MSTVQEIETALSELAPEEFREVEHWMEAWRQRLGGAGADSVLEEYGVTREELDQFDQRMLAKVAEAEKRGAMRPFTGDIEKDIAE